MIWTRNQDEYTATHGGYEIIICRTYSCPPARIPKAQRWTLQLTGPWYMCNCFPTIKAAKAAAERVLQQIGGDA